MPEPEAHDRDLMHLAIDEARDSAASGGVPVGAVLADGDHQVLGSGHNERVQSSDPTAHGEISCLRDVGRRTSYEGCTLYTTLAPCSMCTGAIILFKIPRVVVGEATNFAGELQLLREAGTEVLVLDSPDCIELMSSFIQSNPGLWAEDIAVPVDGTANQQV